MGFKLIRREYAEQYSENVIITFVITLLGIRLFLELTGYPQIAPGNLHFAHALWGGLFLLIASLIVLIYRNQSLLTLSAILTGVGWAFFIDEVGKFITADSDYFFRPAAPIIYLTFLCLWFIAARVRELGGRSPNAQLYHILDRFEEVIEASIDPDDLMRMRQRLQQLSQERQDGITDELAQALLHFVEREDIKTREAQPSSLARWVLRLRRATDQFLLSERAIRYVFPVVLVLYALLLVVSVVAQLLPFALPDLKTTLHSGLDVSPFSSSANTVLFVAMNVLWAFVAVWFLLASRHLLSQRAQGWRMAHRALTVSIVAADLLFFYFSQFSAAFRTVVDVALLGWVNYHHQHTQLLEVGDGYEGPPVKSPRGRSE